MGRAAGRSVEKRKGSAAGPDPQRRRAAMGAAHLRYGGLSAAGSDYGALVVNPSVQLGAVTLTLSGDIENWARGDTKTGPPCSQQQPCD